MPPTVVHTLGELLTDFLGIVTDHPDGLGHRGVCSLKELRVLYTVLSHWRRGSTCTVTQIAGETGISKTTVSRCVTGMMDSRLLEEFPDPQDGRRRLLHPTAEGRQTLQNLDAWLGLWAERLAEFSGDAEPAILVAEPHTARATPGS